jgi:hypothetical protein
MSERMNEEDKLKFHLDCLIFRSNPSQCLKCPNRGKKWTKTKKGQTMLILCGIYSLNGGDLK